MTNEEARNLISRNKSVFQHDTEMTKALDLAIKALEGHEGKFECCMKIKDVISMLLEFDMNEKATIHTTDEYCENNIVISITDKRYEEGGAE